MTEEEQIEQLWELSRNGDKRAKNELVRIYLPLVRYVTATVMQGLAFHVRSDDLYSYGLLGLSNAIDRFDPGRGVRFSTYAVRRIRGAMLDEIRSQDWATRTVRSNAKVIERVSDELLIEHGREPTTTEIAERLKVTEEEVASTAADIQSAELWSLSAFLESNDSIHPGDTDRSSSIYESEYAERLSEAIEVLDEEDRLMLMMYYLRERSFCEIAETVDVTRSRVLQIHKDSLRRLLANV